jgi:8-oxo-dGTP diphosphatase
MPRLAVDVIIVYESDIMRPKIVLIKRRNPPYKDFYALPGGFVEEGERTEEAAIREAKEETGLEVEILKLNGVYSDPERDPRCHVVSICYIAEAVGGSLRANTDARDAALFELGEIPVQTLAFDHDEMIKDAERTLKELIKIKGHKN